MSTSTRRDGPASRPQRSSTDVDRELGRLLDGGELGIQIAVARDGDVVVEAWAGRMDPHRDELVDSRTLFPVFSVSKAVTAATVHLQAERGALDYDAPLAQYWPEYGCRGKGEITVRHVLSHRAGVPQLPADVSPQRMTDWDWMVERLAEQEPVFAPGSRNTYLSMSFGWLLGEIVRRTDPRGRSFSAFVREELCGPVGMDSFHLGLPPAERPRVATLIQPDPFAPPERDLDRRAIPAAVGLVPPVFNRPEIQAACIPAVGGVSDAASLARFFAMIAAGGIAGSSRLFSAERVTSFAEPRPDYRSDDETYGRWLPMGNAGFWIELPGIIDPHAAGQIVGHVGAGGSVAWAELDSGLGFAICHNAMTGARPRLGYRDLVLAARNAAESFTARTAIAEARR